MFKFIVLYEKPDDMAAFLKYYQDVHAPLARKIPGLRKLVVSKITGNAFGGAAPYCLVAEMHFASKADFDAAMASEENKAAGKDAMNFARGLFTPMTAEAWDI